MGCHSVTQRSSPPPHRSPRSQQGAVGASMDVTPILQRRLDLVTWAAETLVILAIITNIAVTFSNTLLRYTTQQDLPWNQAISTIILSIITFLGAPSYFRRSSGMAYNALLEKAVGTRRDALQACGLAIFLGVCCVALLAYPRFFASQRTQSLAVLGLSSVFVAVWLGIGLVLLSLYTIEKLLALSRKGVLAGIGMSAVIAAATLFLRWTYDQGYMDVDPFIAIVPALGHGQAIQDRGHVKHGCSRRASRCRGGAVPSDDRQGYGSPRQNPEG